MKYFLQNILLEIHNKENKISAQSKRLIDEAYEMTLYLQDLLFSVKKYIIEEGFKNDAEEIHFFHTIKPQILGKLIFYNKFSVKIHQRLITGKTVVNKGFTAVL